MASPSLQSLAKLRVAGAVVVCAAAGAGLQIYCSPGNRAALTAPVSAPGHAGKPAAAGPSATAIPTRESLAALSPEDQIASLAAALPQMEIADFLPLVDHLLKARAHAWSEPPSDPFAETPSDLISPMLRALFTRWSALDAAGLMAYVESGPLRYDYDIRRLAVLSLVEVRGLSALEEVRAKSPALARKAARETLIRQPKQLEALLPFLKGGDPNQSLDPFDSSTSDSELEIAKVLSPELYLRYLTETGRGYAAWTMLEELSRTEPQRALQAVKDLPPGPERDSLFANCLLTIAPVSEATILETDYTAFRREFEAMAEGSAKKRLTPFYAVVRMIENPDAALQWAQDLTDPRLRTEALIAISGGMFAACKNTFLDFYGREGDAAERITRQLAAAWTAAPPTGSLHMSPASERMTYPFREWHAKDPAAAEAFLAAVTNPWLLNQLTSSVTLPSEVRLSLLTTSQDRVRHASMLFAPTAFSGGVTALVDFNGIPEAWREAARISRHLYNPPSSEEWTVLTSEERRLASGAVIRQEAKGSADQPSASNEGVEPPFLRTFNAMPPDERSLEACYEAGAAYIKQDETAASQWLDSLPPGAERDAAATALVEHLIKPGDHQDGEAAFAWAAAMSGETERTRYTAEAIRAWSVEDSAAARLGIEAAPLPNREKAALRGLLAAEGGVR